MALAAITAGDGVGLVAALPSLKSSPETEGSVTA